MLSGLDLLIINAVKSVITATTIEGIPVGLYTLGSGSVFIAAQILSIKLSKGKRGRRV